MEPTVTISDRGARRLRAGHLWVYRSDVVASDAPGGSVVVVRSRRGNLLGRALYSDRSEIAVRLVTRGDRPFDAGVLRERLDRALDLREALTDGDTAGRLVHAEGDLLPSLVIDRYADVLVAQALSQGMNRWLSEVVDLLVRRLSPRAIVARHDVPAREVEGLPTTVEALDGEIPDAVSVRLGSIDLVVDVCAGQKTGLFLDQRENYRAAAGYGRGRALDVFSYDGGFALHLARRADEVIAVDVSAGALARLAGNAERNGLRISTREANAFDHLRELERAGERFDTIVLDPPAFARTRAAVRRALGGYKEINLRALKLLAPGGTLVTSSCSFHVDMKTFEETLGSAARDARASVAILERRGQARDHPVLLGVPETGYLKCLIVRRLD